MYADGSFVRYLGGKTLSKEEAWESMALLFVGHSMNRAWVAS
jgi:hypothetical protein